MMPTHRSYRYRVKAADRVLIAVSRNIWMAIRLYAGKRNLTMIEATYRLIAIGIAYEMSVQKESPLKRELKEAKDR